MALSRRLRLGAELRGAEGKAISGLATLQEAGPDQLSFLANPQYRKFLADSRAAAVLLTPAEGEARSRARIRALSLHPWNDLGDRALERHDRDDVPGSEDYRLLFEDWLLPVPQPRDGAR